MYAYKLCFQKCITLWVYLLKREKGQRITEVPTLCPVLDILSYGAPTVLKEVALQDGFIDPPKSVIFLLLIEIH